MKTLGSTGLSVTPIGLGLAAVGRPGYITLGREDDLGNDRSIAALEARTHLLLDAAYAAGVRYVDAARSYGLAEQFLSTWLKGRGVSEDAITIGSKWGYTYVGEWRVDAPVHEVKDHSLAALRRQLAESRALLGSRLRLYQVHSATFESGILDNREVLAELVRLRADGLVIGLTVSGPRQADLIRRALSVGVDGANPFRSVQATWNLLETSAAPALAEAHAAGWGVLVKEALANGRLTPRSREPRMQPLRSLAAERGRPIDAVAIAAALANPWADVVLSGAATVDQLSSNLQALEISLTAGETKRLQEIGEPANEYWGERGALPWT
jgi:aryl-alcohol dehydrogenase-like predicted oxidoreductase